jgi:hypothetical protein
VKVDGRRSMVMVMVMNRRAHRKDKETHRIPIFDKERDRETVEK